MATDSTRSEEVIEDYKKRKLATSALRRIHELIHEFEHDRAADARLARIGIAVILVLIACAVFFFLGSESVTLS